MEAEAALAQREADLKTAQAAVAPAESELGVAQAKVTDAAIAASRAEALLSELARQEASAEAALKLKTTPMVRPASAGHTPKDELARVRQARTEAGRTKAEAALALQQAEQSLQDGQQRVADSRRSVATLAEEFQQRRNALGTLREQQGAAVAEGDAANASFLAALTAEERGQRVNPSPVATSDIPPDFLVLYRWHALSCPGLSWTVLAAIGSIESSHGRSQEPGVHSGKNFAGAMGPMQFLGPTWAAYGRDGDGDGIRDVYNAADAIAGAAHYLCANGAGQLARLASAIWNYNHADWYVASVIQLAGGYAAQRPQTASGPVSTAQILANPNLTLSPEAQGDIVGGRVDPRVVQLLASAASQHRIGVGVLKTGHGKFVRDTDRVSNHYACDGCPGRALDIYEVDGAAVNASNTAALQLALSLLTADPPLRPDEFGSPWPDLSRFPGGFTDDDHQDHLHVGWAANAPELH